MDSVGRTTSYTYDGFGDLLTVTDAAGNVTTSAYDNWGRGLSRTTPDTGTWSYTPDSLGETVSETDPSGNRTRYAYDALGRPTERDEIDLIAQWTYDTASHGVGLPATGQATNASNYVASETSPHYLRSYAYDTLSRQSVVTVTEPALDQGVNSFTFGYDSDGRLSRVQPGFDGTAFTYAYGTYGHLMGLNVTPYGGSSTPFVAWENWNARLQPVELQAGSGASAVTTTRGYDAGTGWLTSIQATAAGGVTNGVENWRYAYDALGNVASRTDGTQSPALTESFTYDGLDRLCTAALSSAVGPATVDGTGQCPAQAPAFTGPQSLANGTVVTNKWLDYNYLGDILTKSDVGTYRYTKVHKIASIALNTGASLNGDPTSPVTLGYDGNGNVTSGPNRTIAYTSYNLPSTIVSNGKTQTWLYDDQHRRFQRSDASSVRYYWDGGMPMEWDTGAGTLKHYVTFQGMNVGEFTATLTGANWASQTDETVYFQTDALGSTVAMTGGMTGGGHRGRRL